jgi:hypothetical protein
MWVGIYLYFISNQLLIKFDQLMLNALSQSTIKLLHSPFPPHLLSMTSAHPCYIYVAQKEEADLKPCEDVTGARCTQPPVNCL